MVQPSSGIREKHPGCHVHPYVHFFDDHGEKMGNCGKMMENEPRATWPRQDSRKLGASKCSCRAFARLCRSCCSSGETWSEVLGSHDTLGSFGIRAITWSSFTTHHLHPNTASDWISLVEKNTQTYMQNIRKSKNSGNVSRPGCSHTYNILQQSATLATVFQSGRYTDTEGRTTRVSNKRHPCLERRSVEKLGSAPSLVEPAMPKPFGF